MQVSASMRALTVYERSSSPQSPMRGRALPDQVGRRGEALRREVAGQPIDHVFDDPVAIVHDGRADLDGGRADEQELDRVLPGLDAADARRSGCRHAGPWRSS